MGKKMPDEKKEKIFLFLNKELGEIEVLLFYHRGNRDKKE